MPGSAAAALASPATSAATSSPEACTTVSQPVPVTVTPSGSSLSGVALAAAGWSGSGTTMSRVDAPAGAENARTESAGVANDTSVNPISSAGVFVSALLHTCTRSGVEVVASTATTIL